MDVCRLVTLSHWYNNTTFYNEFYFVCICALLLFQFCAFVRFVFLVFTFLVYLSTNSDSLSRLYRLTLYIVVKSLCS